MPKEVRNITTLYNWKDNPRGIKKDKFEELKHRITRHGQIKPLIITPDGEVLGGNMRLKAMQELGIEDVWVSVVTPKTEAEKIEIALTDNEEMGYYEDQALAELIEKFKNDIDLTKYSVHLTEPKTLAEILQQFAPDPVEDEAPEVDETQTISKLGEVYQLGRHRLMCGDSTKIEDVERLMDGKKADMVFTDPPYGIDVVQGGTVGASKETSFGTVGGEKIAKAHQYSKVIGDDTTDTAKDTYNLCVSLGISKQIFWGGNYFTDFLPPSPCWLVWNKKNTGNFADVEMAWTNFETGAKLYDFLWNGLSREGDRASELISRVHPTQKPVGLHTRILKDYSSENETIIDLFGGSGSTLIACEQTNRTCYMMELDPKYTDVIRRRYWKFVNNGDETGWKENTPNV